MVVVIVNSLVLLWATVSTRQVDHSQTFLPPSTACNKLEAGSPGNEATFSLSEARLSLVVHKIISERGTMEQEPEMSVEEHVIHNFRLTRYLRTD